MYEEFYKLTTNPFRLAPDPDFCFSHTGYQGAREYLEYALEQGEGFVMVTGRPGTGKTMLVETFLREIDTSKVIARRIAVSSYGADELLRAVAYAYEIDVEEQDNATVRHRIQQYFLQQEQAGRRVLLIMDEAQALQHSALEELRILADLQTQSRTMLQLFLVGQESLQDLMSTPEMEQFQQRVIANYHLMPLNLLEARAYIEHRLLHAGWSGDPEFTSTAVISVYQLSKGVPRHINKICNRLLLLGFGKNSYIFGQEDVQAISTEMHVERLAPMEPGQTLLPDADGINSIPEIHDGSISLDDLAIRADKVDIKAFAISEASRRAAIKKKEFIARHAGDADTWYPANSSPAHPQSEPAAVAAVQPRDPGSPAPENHRHRSALAARLSDRIKWRKETVMLGTAMLVVTTISLAALPSIFSNAPDKEALSHNANQTRSMQDAPGAELAASQEEAVLADVQVTVTGEHLPAADSSRDSTSVQTAAVVAMHTQHQAADYVVDSSSPSQGSQAVVDSRLPAVQEHNADSDYQPVVGHIKRNDQPQENHSPAIAAPVQTVSRAEMAAPAGAVADAEIRSLLLQGRRSIAEYRLLTPEGNNAYDYFRAVLSQEPANEAAHAGIREIVDLYIALARKAVKQQDNDKARRYVNRGLSVQPDNRELLALQDSLDRNKGNSLIVERGVPVSKGMLSAKEEAAREDIISRITTFFKKRKAANSGEITTPAGWDG